DEDGRVIWQRQLGLLCQGEPVLVNAGEQGGPPLLLAQDQGGGLSAIDPTRFPQRTGEPWQSGAQSLAPPLADNPQVAPPLLPRPDGESAYQIACPGPGSQLLVRHVRAAAEGRRLLSTERYVPLAAPLAGTPALVGNAFILPLADGTLARLPVSGEVA